MSTHRSPTLTTLKLRHFRCFEAFQTEFAPGLNLIVGPNAVGKTSLLEAVCVLLRLQSPRVTRIAPLIQHGRRGFVADGFFGGRHLQFYFGRERKKLALDEVEQKSAHEYLQLGRLVYLSNSDIDLVRGRAEIRRRFLDFVASQQVSGYRRALREYQHALRSRNHLLKAPNPRVREIAAFDEPLISSGTELIAARNRLISELQSPVNAVHHAVSGGQESVRLEYIGGATDDFASALTATRAEELRLRQTIAGPHRDDLGLILNDQPSEFASEGQQRTLVLALKLAAARLLEASFEQPPLLLLDDIFGELDLERRNAVFHALPSNAQVLVTTTHLDWLSDKAAARTLVLG